MTKRVLTALMIFVLLTCNLVSAAETGAPEGGLIFAFSGTMSQTEAEDTAEEKPSEEASGQDRAQAGSGSEITAQDETETGADAISEEILAGESAEALIEPAEKENAEESDARTVEPDAAGQEVQVLTAEGEDYRIAVEISPEAGLPAEIQLRAKEAAPGSTFYEEYLDQAERSVGENEKVAFARFFDITLFTMQEDGSEKQWEPERGVNVRIDYDRPTQSNVPITETPMELTVEDEEVSVLHITEKGAEGIAAVDAASDEAVAEMTAAQEMTAAPEPDMAAVAFEAPSFSVYGIIYTVDFWYGEYAFSLEGRGEMLLSDLFRELKIHEDINAVTNVTFTNEDVLAIGPYGEGPDWILISLAPFLTEETLTIEMGNKLLELKVTDDYIPVNNTATSTSFAQNMDISTIQIANLANWPNVTKESNGLKEKTSGGITRYGYQGTITDNVVNRLNGASLRFTYHGAATTADGILCDVVVEYTDIKIYPYTGPSTYRSPSDGPTYASVGLNDQFLQVATFAGRGKPLPAVTAYMDGDESSTDPTRYGLEETVSVKVCRAGTSEIVDGTFVVSVYDMNLNRRSVGSFAKILQAVSHNNFSEYVEIDSSQYDIYYRSDSKGMMEIIGNAIVPTGGGSMSFESGFAAVAKNGKFTMTAFNGGGPGKQQEYYLLARVDNQDKAISYSVTSYSGHGGSIETTTTGDLSTGTVLPGGTVGDQRTYDIPSGKRITYRMTPASGYELNKIYVDNEEVSASGYAAVDSDSNGTPDYYTYTFPAVNTTHKINVTWKRATDPEIPIGHIGMEPDGNGGVKLVNLQSEVSAETAAVTTLDKDGAARQMGTALTPPKISGYQQFTYALGEALTDETGAPLKADGQIPSGTRFYAASDALQLRYTSDGEYQYSVTGGGWETWTGSGVPTVYAVYTKKDDASHTVYATVTAIAKNETDPDFVDPDMEIEYQVEIRRSAWNVTVTNPGAADESGFSVSSQKVGDDEVVSHQTIRLKPGQSRAFPLTYTIAMETVAADSDQQSISREVAAEYLTVTQTVPTHYSLTEISKKGGNAGTGLIETASYTLYSSGNTEVKAPAASREASTAGEITGYTYTFGPDSVPASTEVEFINTRDTQTIILKKYLEDGRYDNSFTHDFTVTVRAREEREGTNGDGDKIQREHFSMLGNHTITGKNFDTITSGEEIKVPAGADILLIERFGAVSSENNAENSEGSGAENSAENNTENSTIKTTDYDTTTTSDPEGMVHDYRPADKEFVIYAIDQDVTVTFENKLKPVIVTVEKKLINGDMNHSFGFTATLKDKNGSPISNYFVYTDEEDQRRSTDANGAVPFSLTANDYVELRIPYGANLTVAETRESGFTTTYTIDEGTGQSGESAAISNVTKGKKIVFTNTDNNPKVCKITDKDGNLLYYSTTVNKITTYSEAVFSNLSNAFGALGNLYSDSACTQAYKAADGVCVKMLVEEYTLSSAITIPAGKITFTTAGKYDYEYPYSGIQNSTARVVRSNSFTNAPLISVTDSNTELVLTDIILDGDNVEVTAQGTLINVYKGSALLKNGTILQRGYASQTGENGQGGGIYIYGGGTVEMYEGATVQKCVGNKKTFYAGGGICLENGKFRMYGGTIRDCHAPNSAGGGLAIDHDDAGYIYDGLITGCTSKSGGAAVEVHNDLYMYGGTITGNVGGTSGAVNFYNNYSRIYLSGSVVIEKNYSDSHNECNITTKNAKNNNIQLAKAGLAVGASIGVTTGESSPSLNSKFGQYETGADFTNVSHFFFDGDHSLRGSYVTEDQQLVWGKGIKVIAKIFLKNRGDGAVLQESDGWYVFSYPNKTGGKVEKTDQEFAAEYQASNSFASLLKAALQYDSASLNDEETHIKKIYSNLANNTYTTGYNTDGGSNYPYNISMNDVVTLYYRVSPCVKITAPSGEILYLESGNPAIFDQLSDAFAQLGECCYRDGEELKKYEDSHYCLKMLTDKYSLNQKLKPAGDYYVTLTTASASDAVFPGPESACEIKRNFADDNMFEVGLAGITFTNIVLDGNKSAYTGGHGGIITTSSAKVTSVTIGEGAILQNSKASSSGAGAVCISGGGQLTISGGKLLNNEASDGYGGAVQMESGTTLTMTGGELRGNTAKNGAAIYLQGSDKTGNAIFYLSGGTITGNSSSEGGAIGVNGGNTRLNVSGSASVTGNTMNSSASNVFINSTNANIINLAGALTGEIGIYVSDTATKDSSTIFELRGGAADRFGNDQSGLHGSVLASSLEHITNDRNGQLKVTTDSVNKLMWTQSIPVEVWYVSSISGSVPTKAEELIYSVDYAPTKEPVSIQEVISGVEGTQTETHRYQNATETMCFFGAFASGVTDLANEITGLKTLPSSDAQYLGEWGYDATWGITAFREDNKKLILLYAEPVYLELINHSSRDIASWYKKMINEKDLMSTKGVFIEMETTDAETGQTSLSYMPVSDASVAEAAFAPTKENGKVRLMILGGAGMPYEFQGNIGVISQDIRVTQSDGEDLVISSTSGSAPNGYNFSFSGKLTSEPGGVSTVTFSDMPVICKVGEKTFSTLRDAASYIGTLSEKTGTIEMLLDYEMPAEDTLEIPEGYHVTLTTADPNATDGHPYKGSSTGIATIKRGTAAVSMLTNHGNLTLTKLVLDGNQGEVIGNGALIYSAQGTLTLAEKATLQGGAAKKGASALGNGGAVYVASGKLVAQGNSLIQNCSAQGEGGGVFIAGPAEAETSYFTIDHCTAGENGGAIRTDGKVKMGDGNHLTSCIAETNGGGIYTTNEIEFNNLEIKDCEAANGGGIYVAANTFSFNNGTISQCRATNGNGGAVFVAAGSFLFKNGTIKENTAAGEGAAVSVASVGSFTMENGTVSNHVGDNVNSVIFSYSGEMTFANGSVTNNSSAKGAITSGGIMNFNGGIKVTGNIYDGKARNVYLNRGGQIKTTGLNDTADVGIYVEGEQSVTAAGYAEGYFAQHGESADPFGTYTGDASLNKFVNDINGLTGMAGNDGQIIWEAYRLTVKKTVTGDYARYDDTFTLNIALKESVFNAEQRISWTKDSENSHAMEVPTDEAAKKLVFSAADDESKSSADLTIQNGQIAEITYLPKGATIVISEVSAKRADAEKTEEIDMFDPTFNVTVGGTAVTGKSFVLNGDATVNLTNRYRDEKVTPTGVSANLTLATLLLISFSTLGLLLLERKRRKRNLH